MDESDFELFDRWCTGDKSAGNLLFKRHFEDLYRFFRNKTKGDGDDPVQDTFLECMKSRDKFARQSSFRTYLFAIAWNVLCHYWRKNAHAPTQLDVADLSIESMSTSIGGRIAKREDRARVVAAFRTLPMGQQALLEMYYWHGLERESLATIFKVEPATIGSRLFRAREALKVVLSSPLADDLFDAWARGLSRDD